MRLGIFGLLLAGIAICQDKLSTDIYTLLDKDLTIPWRDDAIGHPDLIAFRDQLKDAARHHALNTILQVADPGFRGCDMRGLDDLRKLFSATPAAREGLWSEFYKALTEGGVLSADQKSFDSNYAVWTFPMDKAGLFGPEYFRVIKNSSVPVLEHPNAKSRLMARLSYSLVIPKGALVDSGWQQVEFQRGKSGFVELKHLIDPAGMSIRMERRSGKWRIIGIATYCD